MNLRRLLQISAAIGASAFLALSGVLVIITRVEHREAIAMGDAHRSIRAAKEIEADLLRFQRDHALEAFGLDMPDRAERADREMLERHLADAEAMVDAPEERDAVGRLSRDIDDYFLAWNEESADEGAQARLARITPRLEESLAAIDALDRANVREAALSDARIARVDRAADILGTVVSLSGFIACAALVFAFRTLLFRPVLDLSARIRSFGEGDWSVRAPSAPIEELDVISRTFNDMAARLEAQRERQMQFIGSVAHDLRNPMQGLTTLIELRERRARKAGLEAGNGLALREIARLDRMIADLLDVARMESGRLELQLLPADLREAVATSVETIRAGLPGARIVLHAGEDAVRVRCDAVRLHQVLENLLSNARKYSPEGATIEVHVRREGSEGVIAVEDEGVGIEPGEVERIFEPFHRTARGRDVATGLGLGLWSARRIVEAHGGTLTAARRASKGSAFRIAIPLVAERDDAVSFSPHEAEPSHP